MKKYDSYKNPNVEWLRNVPSHWKETRIKYLATEPNSLFLDGDWIESNVIIEEGIRYITTGNIKQGYYSEQGSGYISEDTFKKLNCTEVFEGDLLISRLNIPIGRACIIPNLGNRIVTSVDNVIFRPNKNNDKRFFKYLFSSKEYFEHTELIARGATMQRISRGLLGNLKLCVPSFQEQTQIANYLDHKTIQKDDLIAKKEQLIELLKEERTAIINQAVTKGLDPNVPMKDSGIEWLGEIPEHWEIKRLKHLVSTPLKYGANEAAEEENVKDPRYIRITDFGNDGKLKENTFKSLSFDKAENFLLEEGDILFARSGATVGKTFIFRDYVGLACFAGYLIKATCDINIMLPDFLYSFTNSSGYDSWKKSIFQQATIQNIGADKFNQLKLAVPPINEQIKINNFILTEEKRFSTITKKISQEVELLKEYKTALISEVVTGKVDVRDVVIN